MIRSIPEVLKEPGPVIIDGGLSNVLESMGCDLNHKLWTANLINENSSAIVQAHLSYLEAGAQIITTASYQASIPGLLELGYEEEQAKELIMKSVTMAEKAIKEFLESCGSRPKPIVAASIGPYGAYLADGSEYRGNYDIEADELETFHRPRIELLDQSNADLLACETIPSFEEARVLSEILKDQGKIAWISFSCKDEQHLNDGTSIQQVVKLFKDHPTVFAVGVNCTPPRYITSLIQQIKSVLPEKKIIVYPNSGAIYRPESKTWEDLSEDQSLAKMSEEWIDLGVDLIGGCCRIGPSQIKQLSESIVRF